MDSSDKTFTNRQAIPMLSIKDIIIGSVGTVIPWVVLLIIVGFIIVV